MSKINMTMSGGNSALDMNMNPKQSGTGGTSNYEDLNSKPKINDVELIGELTGDDLGLVDVEDFIKAISDLDLANMTEYCDEDGNVFVLPDKDKNEILVNKEELNNYAKVNHVHNEYAMKEDLENIEVSGGITDVKFKDISIVTDGVANIPQMANGKFGLAQIWNAYGVDINDSGYLMMTKADTNNINTRDANYRAIVPSNLDYAVKSALCDGKGEAWTAPEKASARDRLGCEWRYIGKVETQEDVARMEMSLDSEGKPFNLRKVRVKVVNYPNASDLTTRIRLSFNGLTVSIFHDSEMMTGVKTSETAKMCDVIVEKIGNQLFPIGIYTSINNTSVWSTLTPHTNYPYCCNNNEIDGYINQIFIYSWENVIGAGATLEVWGVDA